MLRVIIVAIFVFTGILSISEITYTQTNQDVVNIELPSATISARDEARQILLDPQRFIEMCKSHHYPRVQVRSWSPLTQMSRYLFYMAGARGDDDFLHEVLMTYVHMGLESINYNLLYASAYGISRELSVDKPCEDYINVVAIEAATHIDNDELLKQIFEEFKDLHNSWVPYAALVNIDDLPYVLDQIREQAHKRNPLPEDATTLDHIMGSFIKRLPSDIRYRDIANVIIDPLAHSALNSIIRVAALQTTNDSYILAWHVNYLYNLIHYNQIHIEENTTQETLLPFYISDNEEEMNMYKTFAELKLSLLTGQVRSR